MKKYCYHCMSMVEADIAVCPDCGTSFQKETPAYHLTPGRLLHNRYLVGYAVGEGGFGITYIGRDKVLNMKVAIKEFYPDQIASRINTTSQNVTARHAEKQLAFFDTGKKNFLSEAQNLAKFSGLPGTVNVIDYFEENNTAYIVMEFLNGITLKQYLTDHGMLSYQKTIELLMPVMQTLTEMHKVGLIHRDISPDNIMVTKNQTKLLDFGAARVFSNVDPQKISVVLKHGYAPEEQYSKLGKQGPWTDVYALCATMYKCVTGKTPDSALDRLENDTLTAPSAMGIQLPPAIEAAILKGLHLHAEDRFQTVEELMHVMQRTTSQDYSSEQDKTVLLSKEARRSYDIDRTEYADLKGAEAAAEPPRSVNFSQQEVVDRKRKKSANLTKLAIAAAAIVLIVGISIGAVTLIQKNKPEEQPQETTTTKPVLVDDLTQDVYVEKAALPSTLAQGEGFKIRGVIKSTDGVIKEVYACILSEDGHVVQESRIATTAHIHNLKKSINKYLLFGNLSKGRYIYRVTVQMEYPKASSSKTLIDTAFEVV